MNSKLLIPLSFLIALLVHILIFDVSVVVFPIDPVERKPKFFFLGPILQQSDVTLKGTADISDSLPHAGPNRFDRQEDGLKNIHYEIVDPEKKPFTIRTIRKPLVSRATNQGYRTQEKSLLSSPEEEKEEEKETIKTEDSNRTLNIQPYRSLRPRSL